MVQVREPFNDDQEVVEFKVEEYETSNNVYVLCKNCDCVLSLIDQFYNENKSTWLVNEEYIITWTGYTIIDGKYVQCSCSTRVATRSSDNPTKFLFPKNLFIYYHDSEHPLEYR